MDNTRRFNKSILFVVIFLLLLIFTVMFIDLQRNSHQNIVDDINIIAESDNGFYFTESYKNNVTWTIKENDKWIVYAYDLATDQKKNLNDLNGKQFPLDIYENQILLVELSGEYKENETNYVFYLYDLLTDKKTALKFSPPELAKNQIVFDEPWRLPQINLYKNKLIYRDSESFESGCQVKIYDILTNSQKVIQSCGQYSESECDPVVANDKIVWANSDNNENFIELYDMQSGEIKTISKHNSRPYGVSSISFDGQHVAWEDRRDCYFPLLAEVDRCLDNIYSYDLLNNTEKQITDHLKTNQSSPYLIDDKIFWSDDRNEKSRDQRRDIYYALLVDNKEVFVYGGNDFAYNYVFGAYGNKIIWNEMHSNNTGNSMIKVATLED